jgi:hypothetical protein
VGSPSKFHDESGNLTWALTAIYYFNIYQRVPSAPHFLVEALELLAGVPLALIIASMGRRAATRGELRNR